MHLKSPQQGSFVVLHYDHSHFSYIVHVVHILYLYKCLYSFKD